MRPHVRVFPLLVGVIVLLSAMVSYPVRIDDPDCPNGIHLPRERRLGEPRSEEVACEEPRWEPWIVRWATQGY